MGFVGNLTQTLRREADLAGGEFLNNLTGINLCGNIGAFLRITLRTPGLSQQLGCSLTDIERNGRKVSISTKPFVAQAEATKKRDAAVVGGGAGVGAVIGAIAGGKKGAAIGGAVGGGAGTGAVLATKGKDIHYPPETRLSFTLASSLII